jgi:type II secretory pathway pseudopilin PulG
MIAAARTQEGGFTLVELLVAMTLGIVVLGAAVMLFTNSITGQPALQARDFQIQQARTAMDRMVREIHQGSTVSTATASQLTVITYVDSTCSGGASSTAVSCQVTYSCSGSVCTRTLRNPDGTGSAAAVQVVSGLSSPNVFTYSPSSTAPTYVGVTLSFSPQKGQSAVTLDDGAALENLPQS